MRRAGSTSPASWPRRSKGCDEEPGPRERFGTELEAVRGEGPGRLGDAGEAWRHGLEEGDCGGEMDGGRDAHHLAGALEAVLERRAMTKHMTGTRNEWLAARLELLEAEKELTRRSDELARRRQELPWVRIDKEYRFETDEGSASLADLFRGRSQLLVYHFMFGPDYKAGCPSCS